MICEGSHDDAYVAIAFDAAAKDGDVIVVDVVVVEIALIHNHSTSQRTMQPSHHHQYKTTKTMTTTTTTSNNNNNSYNNTISSMLKLGVQCRLDQSIRNYYLINPNNFIRIMVTTRSNSTI